MSRVYKTAKGQWVHVSDGKTTKLRYFDEQIADEALDAADPKIEDIKKDPLVNLTPGQVDRILQDNESPFLKDDKTFANVSGWKNAFAKMEALYEEDGELRSFTPKDPETNKKLVPQTAIRKLYEMMRDGLIATPSRKSMAEQLANNPKHLSNLVDSSVRHFERYSNTERLHERTDDRRKIDDYLNVDNYPVNKNIFAKRIVALLRDDKTRKNPSSLKYLDYEISPYRTTGGASMEDGTPASKSGGGGIDLLMLSGEVPILGEVKSKGDTDFFLSLIHI